MFVSKIPLKDIIQYIDNFLPVKVTLNGVDLYNDYDSTKLIEILDDDTMVYGEKYSLNHVWMSRIENFEDYIVTSINIIIVDYHHSIIHLHCNLTG